MQRKQRFVYYDTGTVTCKSVWNVVGHSNVYEKCSQALRLIALVAQTHVSVTCQQARQ